MKKLFITVLMLLSISYPKMVSAADAMPPAPQLTQAQRDTLEIQLLVIRQEMRQLEKLLEGESLSPFGSYKIVLQIDALRVREQALMEPLGLSMPAPSLIAIAHDALITTAINIAQSISITPYTPQDEMVPGNLQMK